MTDFSYGSKREWAKRPSAPWAGYFLWILCLCAAFIASCGGEGSDVASNASGGTGGAATPDASGGTGGVTTLQDAQPAEVMIAPATASLLVTDKAVSQSQAFTATVDGAEVPAVWTLDNYNLATVDGSGLVSSVGFAGGKVKVIASYGGGSATAELTIEAAIQEDVSSPIDPADKTALQGPPTGPGSTPADITYPYDQTVFPKGLLAPLLMMKMGAPAPSTAKVKLSAPLFSWEGYYNAGGGNQTLTVPQDVWDAATETAAGGVLDVEITKATGGVAYGPFAIQLTIAAGSLRGVVFYQTYDSPNGLYSVRPGDTDPAQRIKSGCVVCHSLSANGELLSVGAGNAEIGEAGIYEIDPSGSINKLMESPPSMDDTLSTVAWTPDGKYLLRDQHQHWGGTDTVAWRVDAAAKTLSPASLVGFELVSAYLPTFSPDGTRIAFTQGDGEAAPPGTPRRSVDIMDVAIDENQGPAGTITFSNRQVVVDNGAGGKLTKYVTFLPDRDWIVAQESKNAEGSYGQMRPTKYNDTYGAADGALTLIDIANARHVELARANAPVSKNYEPFALPIPMGGYYWVVFTSIRPYGHELSARKQLWVTAVSPNVTTGDPSHPPFFIPNQSPSKNERGFWALDPCKPAGDGCAAGDECCDGFCRPSDPSDPGSSRVCGGGQGCSELQEKCTSDADCCGAGGDVRCLGGFCSPGVPR